MNGCGIYDMNNSPAHAPLQVLPFQHVIEGVEQPRPTKC